MYGCTGTLADFTDLHACQCIHTSDPSFAYICVIVNTENTKIQTTTKVGAAKIRSDHGHANHYKSWELGTKIRAKIRAKIRSCLNPESCRECRSRAQRERRMPVFHCESHCM